MTEADIFKLTKGAYIGLLRPTLEDERLVRTSRY